MNLSSKSLAILLVVIGVVIILFSIQTKDTSLLNSGHDRPPDALNSFGLLIIDTPARFVGIAVLVLVGVLSAVSKMRGNSGLGIAELLGGVVALLSLYSALIIAAVFLLTDPPAIAHLPALELIGVGTVSAFVLAALAIKDLYGKFIIKKAGASSSSTTPPA